MEGVNDSCALKDRDRDAHPPPLLPATPPNTVAAAPQLWRLTKAHLDVGLAEDLQPPVTRLCMCSIGGDALGGRGGSRNWHMLSLGGNNAGLGWHMHGKSWLGLVYGRKRWYLYGPGEHHCAITLNCYVPRQWAVVHCIYFRFMIKLKQRCRALKTLLCVVCVAPRRIRLCMFRRLD